MKFSSLLTLFFMACGIDHTQADKDAKSCQTIAVGTTLEALAKYNPQAPDAESQAFIFYNSQEADTTIVSGPVAEIFSCHGCPVGGGSSCASDCSAPPYSDGSAYSLQSLYNEDSNNTLQSCAVWIENDKVTAVWIEYFPG